MQTDDPMDYRIADLRIRIPGECLPGPLHPAFSPFAEPENGTPALLLHTARQIADVPEECCLDRFPCIDTTTECRFIRWSGGIQLELYGPQGDSVRFRLPDGGREACTDCRPDRQPSQLRFGLWLLCNAAGLGHGVVSLHAAAISHRGQGVLFLGESGTGKSTHARLWCRHMAATELLNDDNPTIRIQGDTAYAHGTPWSGKTPCYKPQSFPIGGMVRLIQAPENRFHRQEGADAFVALYPGCSVISQDQDLRARLYDTLVRLAERVPTGILECRPDSDAAILCYRSLLKIRQPMKQQH